MSDEGGPFGGTPDEYCDYVLQSYLWGELAGVDKYFHFQLDNSNGHGLYDSMLGRPKPVLTTYQDVLGSVWLPPGWLHSGTVAAGSVCCRGTLRLRQPGQRDSISLNCPVMMGGAFLWLLPIRTEPSIFKCRREKYRQPSSIGTIAAS